MTDLPDLTSLAAADLVALAARLRADEWDALDRAHAGTGIELGGLAARAVEATALRPGDLCGVTLVLGHHRPTGRTCVLRAIDPLAGRTTTWRLAVVAYADPDGFAAAAVAVLADRATEAEHN